MAAAPFITEDAILGSAARNAKKSFAKILSGRFNEGDVPIHLPTTYCNQPAIEFSVDEEKVLSECFKYALVGKFSRGLPVSKDIHPALIKLGLRGTFTVGALKPGYILINPSLEEDFARLWVRQEWFIAGRPMRLFKWTPAFTYARESSIVPIWINLPDLPLHLFAKGALYSIASLVGNPIKVDEPTANRSRPSIARVCVEIDLLRQTVPHVIIRSGKNTFEQKIFYEDMPTFCNICFHRGHHPSSCFSNGRNQPPNKPKIPIPTETTARKPTQETNGSQPQAHPNRNTNTPNPSQNPQTQLKQPPVRNNNTTKTVTKYIPKETNNQSQTQSNQQQTQNTATQVTKTRPQDRILYNKTQPFKRSRSKRVTFLLKPINKNKKTKSYQYKPSYESCNPGKPTNTQLQNQSPTSATCELGETSKKSRQNFGADKATGKLKIVDSKKPANSLNHTSKSTNPISLNRFSDLELIYDIKPSSSRPSERLQKSTPPPAEGCFSKKSDKQKGISRSDSHLALLSYVNEGAVTLPILLEKGQIDNPSSCGLLLCKSATNGPTFSNPSLINYNQNPKICSNTPSPLKSPNEIALTHQPVSTLIPLEPDNPLVTQPNSSLPSSSKINPHQPNLLTIFEPSVTHSSSLPLSKNEKEEQPDQRKILSILNQQADFSSNETDFREIKGSLNMARRNSIQELSTSSMISKIQKDHEEVSSKRITREKAKLKRPVAFRSAFHRFAGSSKSRSK